MERKYFIMNLAMVTEQEKNDALNDCIGLSETQRYSLDNTKLYFKCDDSHNHNYNCCTEYTLEEVKVILNNSEWQIEDLF